MKCLKRIRRVIDQECLGSWRVRYLKTHLGSENIGGSYVFSNPYRIDNRHVYAPNLWYAARWMPSDVVFGMYLEGLLTVDVVDE